MTEEAGTPPSVARKGAAYDPAKEKKLLRNVALGVSIEKSALAAGIPRSSLYKRRDEDEDFREAIKTAEARGCVRAAEEVRRTLNATRLKAALAFLIAHDRRSWRTNIGLRVGGGLEMKGKGIAELMRAADAQAQTGGA